MTSVQRLIKICANALAVLLIVGIFGGISSLLLLISGGVSLKNDIKDSIQSVAVEDTYTPSDEVKSLEMEIAAANIAIKTGKQFTVEYSGSALNFSEKKGTLKIEERTLNFFGGANANKLIITVPSKMVFDEVSVDSGAGDIYIQKLVCDKFSVDLGAGAITADYLKVKSRADIDGGAGKITVSDGSISNLDISVGAGRADITAALKGRSLIEAGVGEFNLSLKGEKSDYTIEAETGIGEIRVDGKKVKDGDKAGDGVNLVEIEGGVGSVKVEFLK